MRRDEDAIQIGGLRVLAYECPEASAKIFHVPNEQTRTRRNPSEQRAAMIRGAHIKAMGRKKGVPDLVLPIARGGFFHLYIEVKSATGRMSPEQKQRRQSLTADGNQHVVVRSSRELVDVVCDYMRLPPTVGGFATDLK